MSPPSHLLLLQLILLQGTAAPSAALAAVSSAASVSSSVANNLDLWTNDFTFAQAQSRAVCLHMYVDELTAQSSLDKTSNAARDLASLQGQPQQLMDFCSRSVSCRGCLTATSFHPRLAVCQHDCKDLVYCEQSCTRLRSFALNRPGSCPAATDPRTIACSAACSTDMDCVYAEGYKCCNTGLCRACRPPAPSRQPLALPRSPTPSLVKVPGGSGLLLTWPYANATNEHRLKEPIVYAVQARYMVGRRFESGRASSWRNVSLVASNEVAVEEVRTGHNYQFRVAAVTRLGTMGFGPPSEPYLSGSQPQAPGAPSLLSQGQLRISYSSGRVSVWVHWKPPSQSELPVQLYKIRWTKDLGFVNSHGSVLSVTRFSNSRPGNARSYLIENLERGTSYKVEIRAASFWGDETLLGPPNSIYVSTPHLESGGNALQPQQPPHPDSAVSSSRSSLNNNDEACSTAASASSYDAAEPHEGPQQTAPAAPATATPLHIQPPIYEDSQLTIQMLILGVSVGSEETLYRVQWRRRVCIDTPGNGKLFTMTVVAQSGYFKLTELQFNCRYWVRLTPIDSTSGYRLRNITACFRTPSCDEVKVAAGSVPPEQCPAALEAQTPEPPGRIHVSQLGVQPDGGGLSYRIAWTPARPSKMPASLTDASSSYPRHRQPPTISGYCIVWGPRLDEPVSQSSYLTAGGGNGAPGEPIQLGSGAAVPPGSQAGPDRRVSAGLYPQMDPDKAITRVLGRANTSLVIRDLRPGTLYIVQVHSQAFHNGQLLVSPSSSYFFATPPGVGNDGNDGQSQSFPSGGASAEIRKYVQINSDHRLTSASSVTAAPSLATTSALLLTMALLNKLSLAFLYHGA